MKKVVIDTNIIISSALGGALVFVLEKWHENIDGYPHPGHKAREQKRAVQMEFIQMQKSGDAQHAGGDDGGCHAGAHIRPISRACPGIGMEHRRPIAPAHIRRGERCSKGPGEISFGLFREHEQLNPCNE